MKQDLLIPIAVSGVVFLVFTLISQALTKNAKKEKQIQKMVEIRDLAQSNEEFLESLRSERPPTGFTTFMNALLSGLGIDMEHFRAQHQLQFYQAGLHSPNAHIYYFLYTRVVSVILLGIGIWLVMQKDAGLLEYAEALLIVFFGLLGAETYIKNLQAKRKKTLQNSFPDALDLLLACVEAGLALDGALLRVCKELGRAHPVITQELNRLRVELSLLNDRVQALNNFAERNGMVSFRQLVTALLQSEKFGTSLTDTLRIMSEDYRTERLVRAEEKAGRLPALITMPLIIFLLPALMLIILGPAVISSMDSLHKHL